jgi:hypothetical protein
MLYSVRLIESWHVSTTEEKWCREVRLPDDDNNDDACGWDDDVESWWRLTLGDGWISSSVEPWLLSDVCLLSNCCRCCK